MKIVKKDLKHDILSVIPETQDDLWILEKMINKGDIISGYTLRTIKISQGDKEIKTQRKRILVKLVAEKIEFSGDELRINGNIIESSEGDHSHHTFEIAVNRKVTIERDWKKYELEKLEKSKTKLPKVLILALDDSEASFAILSQKLENLTTIYGKTGKSMGEQDNSQYYNELVKYITEKEFEFLIIAGPGFAKENLMNLIKKKESELIGKITVGSVSYPGEAGIQEILRRGIIEKIVEESSIGEQSKLIEEFFSLLSSGDKIMYGLEETKKAIEMGAVKTLLISDNLVKENEELMKLTENYGGSVKIIDSHHESGKRFLSFGGIAAFLRYDI